MKNELDDQLIQQTRLGSGLRRQLKEACASKQLATPIDALRRVHRQLERSEASFPRTARAGRYRRWAVEDLQAQSRALEAQLSSVSATASQVDALLQQQLQTIQSLLRDAPGVAPTTFGVRGPHYPFLIIALIAAGGCFFMPAGYFSAGCFALVALLAPASVRLAFDGRSLRVHRAWFGVKLWTSIYDLTRFNRVGLDSLEFRDEYGSPSVRYALMLASPDREVRLGFWSARTEVEARQRELQGWCEIAARDAA